MLVMVVCVILLGCSQEADILDQQEVSTNDSVPEDNVPEGTIVTNVSAPGECDAGWKCISSSMKAYRQEDCSFGERVQCPLGCFNDTCRAASTCSSGFKCINDHRKGYQTEACNWINDVECPGGCQDGECLLYNETAAQQAQQETAQAAADAPPPDTSRTLSMGEQEVVEINEQEHIISLYILEASRTKFSIDGFKTDWLEEGNSILIRGLNLTIKEILFQSYPGGAQQVRYTIE